MIKAKTAIQQFIRSCHLFAFRGNFPSRIGLYLHSLEKSHRNAFAEMINYFHDAGYRFVDADDFCNPNAKRVVFLSFDDNYHSWYEALPLFESLGVRATFYANSLPFRDVADSTEIEGYYDRVNHFNGRIPLSRAEIVEIANCGHTIGCHGHSHRPLARLTEDDAKDDIRRGKEELENTLGFGVEHFSYPFGFRRHFRRQLREYCLKIGFRTIANATPGLQYREQTPLSINRNVWRLDRTLSYNLDNICVDGRMFEFITGRSAVG